MCAMALAREYAWPGLSKDMAEWATTCATCAQTKVRREKPAGKLMALPVPYRVGEWMHVDFLGPLHPSHGMNNILVCVDRLSRMVFLVGGKTSDTSIKVAERLWSGVFAYVGVPKILTTDRDPKFMSKVFGDIMTKLGVKMATTTAYNPRSDGMAERRMSEIKTLLRSMECERTKDWVSELPMVQYFLNSTIMAQVKMTPFEMAFGENVEVPAALGIAAPTEEEESMAEASTEWLQRRRDQLRLVHDAWQLDRIRMMDKADRKLRDVKYQVGDWVWMSNTVMATRVSGNQQLADKWIGPFRVEALVGPNACRISSKEMFPRMHPVVSVRRLMKVKRSDRFPVRRKEPTAMLVKQASETPAQMVERRRNKGRMEYLIEFLDGERRWMRKEEIADFEKLRAEMTQLNEEIREYESDDESQINEEQMYEALEDQNHRYIDIPIGVEHWDAIENNMEQEGGAEVPLGATPEHGASSEENSGPEVVTDSEASGVEEYLDSDASGPEDSPSVELEDASVESDASLEHEDASVESDASLESDAHVELGVSLEDASEEPDVSLVGGAVEMTEPGRAGATVESVAPETRAGATVESVAPETRAAVAVESATSEHQGERRSERGRKPRAHDGLGLTMGNTLPQEQAYYGTKKS